MTGHKVTPKQWIGCTDGCVFFFSTVFSISTLPVWFQADVWSHRNGHTLIYFHVPAVHHMTLEQTALHLVNFSLFNSYYICMIWTFTISGGFTITTTTKRVHLQSNLDYFPLKTVSPKVTSLLFSQILVPFGTFHSHHCLILPNMLTHNCDFQFCTRGTWRSMPNKQHQILSGKAFPAPTTTHTFIHNFSTMHFSRPKKFNQFSSCSHRCTEFMQTTFTRLIPYSMQ